MKKINIICLALIANIGIYAESGKCGENLTWEIANDVLTIRGSGPMEDYDANHA